jgi:hypothetical protein
MCDELSLSGGCGELAITDMGYLQSAVIESWNPAHAPQEMARLEESSIDTEAGMVLLLSNWEDCTTKKLIELLLTNIGSLYNRVIQILLASEFNVQEAQGAVLRHTRYYWGRDAEITIVKSCMNDLERKQRRHDQAGTQPQFSDMKALHMYSLNEMVGSLRDVRPNLIEVESVWYLLMADMNVPHACLIDPAFFSQYST